jgi:hypothetical protein
MKTELIKIAVCGHRHLDNPEHLLMCIQKVSEMILAVYPDARFQVYSCLAEGADRLLAESFIELLDAGLTVVLPMPEKEYIHDFKTPGSIEIYRNLAQKARKFVILHHGPKRPLVYQEAARYLLKKCDLLVAVWDGKPSRGPGGTAQTIEIARQRNLPILWIHSQPESDMDCLTKENLSAAKENKRSSGKNVNKSGSRRVGMSKIYRKSVLFNSHRKHVFFNQIWYEARWIFICLVWLAGLILGVAGFSRYAIHNALNWSTGTVLYKTLQLVSIESGAVEGVSNWMLELARFLLPVLTAYTAFQALMHLFKEQLKWLRLWRLRGHIIVYGPALKSSRLAIGLLDHGYKVVIINNQDTTTYEIKRKQAITLHGDAIDSELLARARLSRASHLICLLDEDRHNLQLAINAFKLNHDRRKGRLTCVVHMDSTELFELVKKSEMAMDSDRFQLEIFSPYARGAQLLLSEDLVWRNESGLAQLPGHILVVGCGRLGENLISHAAYTWHCLKQPDRMKITMLDREAAEKKALLLKKIPQIERACQLIPLDGDFSVNTQLTNMIEMAPDNPLISRVYICLDDPVLGLQVCLNLLNQRKLANAKINCQIGKENDFLELLKKNAPNLADAERIIPFDLFERTCSIDLVVGGLHEQIAQGLYQSYLGGIQISHLERPWIDLPENEKEDNRQQANRINSLVKTFGYRINPLQNWEAASLTWRKQDIEPMARMEHALWCKAKRSEGWRFGSNRDDQKRLHPDLVDWEKLSASEQQKNIHYIEHLPVLLAGIGYQIDREE